MEILGLLLQLAGASVIIGATYGAIMTIAQLIEHADARAKLVASEAELNSANAQVMRSKSAKVSEAGGHVVYIDGNLHGDNDLPFIIIGQAKSQVITDQTRRPAVDPVMLEARRIIGKSIEVDTRHGQGVTLATYEDAKDGAAPDNTAQSKAREWMVSRGLIMSPGNKPAIVKAEYGNLLSVLRTIDALIDRPA